MLFLIFLTLPRGVLHSVVVFDCLLLEESLPLQIPSAACQQQNLDVTLSLVMLILSGTRHCMGDLGFYLSKSLYLYKTKQLSLAGFHFLYNTVQYMFSWIKSKNGNHSFHTRQAHAEQIFFLDKPRDSAVVKPDFHFPFLILTVNTWRSVSCGSSHLPWQTRTLDRLWPLLNTILITASVSSNYFTCASLW